MVLLIEKTIPVANPASSNDVKLLVGKDTSFDVISKPSLPFIFLVIV